MPDVGRQRLQVEADHTVAGDIAEKTMAELGLFLLEASMNRCLRASGCLGQRLHHSISPVPSQLRAPGPLFRTVDQYRQEVLALLTHGCGIAVAGALPAFLAEPADLHQCRSPARISR